MSRSLLGAGPALLCVQLGWTSPHEDVEDIDGTAHAIATELALGASHGGLALAALSSDCFFVVYIMLCSDGRLA